MVFYSVADYSIQYRLFIKYNKYILQIIVFLFHIA